jgi:hypothetical protein
MKNRLLPALLVLCMGISGTSYAREPALPLGLAWCQPIGEVLAKMPDAREMSDDVLDSTKRVWGVEGFVSAIMEDDKLVSIRFRAFEAPADLKKIRSALVRNYGQGGSRGTATHWAVEGGVRVEMKLQSEQIFIHWETSPGRCETGEKRSGLSDQEKADAESLKAKKAVNWDPYADDVDQEAVKKKAAKKEEKEEEKEEKKDEPTLNDDEVDW